MGRRRISAKRKDFLKKLKSIDKNKKKRKKKKKLSKKQKALLKEETRSLGERPKLRPSQIEGIEFLESNNFNAIIADSMGTGKTAQALVTLARNAKKLLPAIVVCPSSVAWNWRREAYKWIRSSVRVHVIDGMQDKLPKRQPHITVVSWDLLHYRIEDLKLSKFNCIVADEAHYAKNPESLRTKAFQQIETNHKILLTGTPLINNKEELNVLKCLIGTDNVPIIRRLLDEVAPDVPPKKRIVVNVDIAEQIEEEYEEIDFQFDLFLDSYLKKIFGDRSAVVEQKVDSAMQNEYLTKISYLRRSVGRGKIPAVSVWAKQMIRKGNSVAIYGEHQDVLDFLCQSLKTLGIGHVRIDGGTGRTERQIAIDSFQNGSVKCFIGSRAAIEGFTLHKANHLAFLERYFTPAAEEQAEDRIRRIGQNKATYIWYFIASGTIDERIQNIVSRKRRIVDREIGVEDIEEEELSKRFDSWRNTKVAKEIKTLKELPKSKESLPKLPDPKYVRGFFFGMNGWSIPFIQKSLRRRGFKILDMQTKNGRVFISTRSPNQFDKSTIKMIEIDKDLTVIVGKPVSNKKRLKNYRINS